MLFRCCGLYGAVINNSGVSLHQAPSCLTCAWVLVLIQLQKESQINQGLWPRARWKAAVFGRGPWGIGKSLPTTARLQHTTFPMGFSCVSSQKSRQEQEIDAECPLNHCIYLQLETGCSKPKSLQVTTSNWLYDFVNSCWKPQIHQVQSQQHCWNWEKHGMLRIYNLLLETFFFPLSLPSTQHFRQRCHFCSQSCLSKGLKYFHG